MMLVCSLLGPKPKRVAEGLFSLQNRTCNQRLMQHMRSITTHLCRRAGAYAEPTFRSHSRAIGGVAFADGGLKVMHNARQKRVAQAQVSLLIEGKTGCRLAYHSPSAET